MRAGCARTSALCIGSVSVDFASQIGSSVPRGAVAMQQHMSHLMHRHEHRLPVDTKKNDRDKPPPPPPAKERPAEGPLGANSAKAKSVKLHRAPSSFKALTDVLVAGRRLQHRCFAALEF